MKTQLGYYCYNSFRHKTFRIRRACSWNFAVEILVLAIWRNTYGERQLIMKCQTWNMTIPNAIQISNGKQEANNKECKAKTYKKASLSTSLTNLYATKLNFAIEITTNNWLVQSRRWKHKSSVGDTSLRCTTNDMNKSLLVVSVKRAKQNACKDLFKVGSQKNKAMDRNALSSKLTKLNRPVSKTNKECQTI